MIDTRNSLKQHTVVGLITLAFVFGLISFLDLELSTSLGRTSFVLLFLILVIGPLMKIRRPAYAFSPLTVPWSWRGELGIWFTVTALAHFLVVWSERPLTELIKIGGAGYSLANLLGMAALVFALLLAATSFGSVIKFLGVESWKWLHGFVYVIFYLISAHFMYFQFFSTYGDVGPDWFGYVAVAMTSIVIVLQIVAFISVVRRNRAVVV